MYIALTTCGTMGSQWPSPAAPETIAKKRDRKSKPSKCRCALCSTTAIPSEDAAKQHASQRFSTFGKRSDIDLATRENTGLNTQLGELNLDFEDASQFWGKDRQLNVRAGRMQIPFGEEYMNRYAMENPLISHSLSDFWGVDPGVELYGSLGKFSYVAAVQNGGGSGVQDFDGDKSVAGRISFDPNKHWHFSVSGLRTGDLNSQNDYVSAVWFGNGWFRSIGSPAASG